MLCEGNIVTVEVYFYNCSVAIDRVDHVFGARIPYKKLSHDKNGLIIKTKDPTMPCIKLSPVCIDSKKLWKIEKISLR